jgi:NADPH-dependent 2,4-dienoyl-CoA reductase/sulfur reductase-like enzyme
VTTPCVVVVGAGPAGIRAAMTLVEHGFRPIVVDEAARAGGQIYRRPPAGGFTRSARSLYGFEAGKAVHLHEAFDALGDRIDYRPRTLAWSLREKVLYTERDGVLENVPFDALILATGATDLVLPMPGWTTPGTFTLGGAQVALKYQGCAVGRRTVFLGASPLLYLVAWQYAVSGAEVAAVLDTSALAGKFKAAGKLALGGSSLVKGLYYMAALRGRGVRIATGVEPLGISGTDSVTGLRYRDGRGREHQIACEAVAYGYGLRPEAQLADLAGCRFRFDPTYRQWFPDTDREARAVGAPGVYLAGDGARIGGADAAEAGGELAALAIARDLGRGSPDAKHVAALGDRLARLHRFQAEGLARAFAIPTGASAALPDDVLVCRCESVTAGELRRTTTPALGASEINRAKALSRLGMGRCQGRFCAFAGAEVLARALGVEQQAVGRLRGQAPVKPIPLGSRAAASQE